MRWRIQPKNGRALAELPDGEARIRTLTDNFDAPNTDVVHFHNISLVGGPGVLGLGTNRRAVRIFFSNAASHHCGGRKAQPKPDRKHQAQERFRQPHGRDGVCSKPADPENIHHCEQRLQHHFQHHRNRQGNCKTAGVFWAKVIDAADQQDDQTDVQALCRDVREIEQRLDPGSSRSSRRRNATPADTPCASTNAKAPATWAKTTQL